MRLAAAGLFGGAGHAINDHRPETLGEPHRRVQRADGRWQVHIRHTDEDGSSSRHTGSTAKESRDEAADVRARLRRSSVTRASRSLETSMATSRLTCLVTH